MRKMKMLPIFSGIILFCTCLLIWQSISVNNKSRNSQTSDLNSLPVITMHGSFVYDPNNINESVGMVDYVFTGTVVSNNGTIYKDTVTMEDENGKPKDVSTPYTDYTIQVSSNIKGNLQIDEPIRVLKKGGITQKNTEIYLFENDVLPEEGKAYIFLAFAQPDGSLLISGPNSNVLITATENYSNTGKNTDSTLETYLDAYKNQIIPIDRERFTSIYEAE